MAGGVQGEAVVGGGDGTELEGAPMARSRALGEIKSHLH
jgi:hypothetical protein